MFTVLAVGVHASVAVSFDIEEATTDTGASCYNIVFRQTDTEGDWRALETSMKFNYNKIIPIDYYDGTIPSYTGEAAQYPFKFNSFKNGRSSTASLTLAENPVWTIDGENSHVLLTLYWGYTDTYPITASDTMIFEMYFKYADGVTKDDLVSSDFVIESLAYGNGSNWGFNNDDPNKMEVTNKVVPEVVAITIPVLAGDKVYLQDGTKATAEVTGEYQVLSTKGYVAVNTGITAQKTYYIDGATAELVHTNGIVSREDNQLRGPDEKSSVADDTSGLRFLMNHNPLSREVEGHEVTEVGVLMTVESTKVTSVVGQETIDNLKVSDAGSYVLKGTAYGGGIDKAWDTSKDDNWIITAVMYNIKLNEKNVQTNIVCRPYYKVGDTYIYGETMKATLYNVAKSVEEGGYVGCSDELKGYIDDILFCVDGEDTPVVDGEVIIDISGLYTKVG
jgi:hypothetical protein